MHTISGSLRVRGKLEYAIKLVTEFMIFSTLQSYEFSSPGSSFEGISQISPEDQG